MSHYLMFLQSNWFAGATICYSVDFELCVSFIFKLLQYPSDHITFILLLLIVNIGELILNATKLSSCTQLCLFLYNSMVSRAIEAVWDITEGLGMKCTARHC